MDKWFVRVYDGAGDEDSDSYAVVTTGVESIRTRAQERRTSELEQEREKLRAIRAECLAAYPGLPDARGLHRYGPTFGLIKYYGNQAVADKEAWQSWIGSFCRRIEFLSQALRALQDETPSALEMWAETAAPGDWFCIPAAWHDAGSGQCIFCVRHPEADGEADKDESADDLPKRY